MKDKTKKWLTKIGLCLFAWIFVFILATFIDGSFNWIIANDPFPRFGYCIVCIFSNVFIIGSEYIA